MSNKLFQYYLRISLTIVVVFTFVPLALLIGRGTPNVVTSIRSEEIIFAIKLSFITSSISTLICLFFALPTAYLLARFKTKVSEIISILIFLPMSLPHIISGIALLLFLGNLGIGKYLARIGIDFVFTKKGIIAAQVFINIPFMIKMIKTSIEESSSKMEFIARTLGCTKWQSLRYITIPLIRNGLISSIIITWSRALGEFGAVAMLAGATRMKTEVLSTSIFLNMSTGDLDIAIGTSTILIIISLVSIFLLELLNKIGLERE